MIYYKAGDEGDYDLYFHPEDLALPGAGFDAEALARLCAGFERICTALSGDPGLSRAICSCETAHHADPALRRLSWGAFVCSSMHGVTQEPLIGLPPRADHKTRKRVGRAARVWTGKWQP